MTSVSRYTKAQKALEEENRVHRKSSPKRAKLRQPLFVASNFDNALARPLSPGLQYAAAIADFEELSERHIWDLPIESRSFLSQAQVDSIFRAKCEDQQCSFSFDRAQRFTQLMFERCQGEWCSLRQCGLGLQALRAVVDTFVDDRNITHLDLSGNTFGPEAGDHFARLLQQNKTIVVLRLQSINIGEGVCPMMNALKNNNHLTALDLSGIAGITRNTIWGTSAQSVAQMLLGNQVLSSINLAHCGLQRSASAITKACAQHIALTKLDLSGNKIKDDGCRAVGDLLSRGTCALLSLALEENQITCAGATILGDALKATDSAAASNLEQLHLGYNSIGSHGLSAIAAAVKDHPKLQLLSLTKNKLCNMGVDDDGYRIEDSSEGIAMLFTAVESSNSLAVIKMSSCGIAVLPSNVSYALNRTNSLQRLEIAENPFQDAGGVILAEGISKNKSLTSLDCTQCGMSTAMTSLAQALAGHKNLLHLRINQGCWDVHGSGMVDALKQNSSVLSVDLGKDAMDSLRGALSRNKQMRVQRATPQLEEKQKELASEEKLLQETQEFIVDEIKSREKAVDLLKVTRERQKVYGQQMKDEIDALKAQNEAGQQEVERLQTQMNNAEEDFNNKNRELENERHRTIKKTETAATQKADFIAQLSKHAKQYPHLFPDGPPGGHSSPTTNTTGGNPNSGEALLNKTEVEYRMAVSATKEVRENCEMLQSTLADLLQQIAALTGPPVPATATSPQKKK